ncbi:B2 protein [Hibiscus syriacus]|uniref:B2 protein n=1 Tax=Hibiscus syriacus TaxID=106335 RepID=A0A6A2X9N5_HIBSY|nr:B2 protein [Hibiscus syriacus]
MENNQQSFWQFSDQLRIQNTNLANLSLNDSIWSNAHVSKRPDERRNFDIRLGEVDSVHNLKPKPSDFNSFNDDGWKIGVGSINNNMGFDPMGSQKNTRINGGGNKNKGEDDHGSKSGKNSNNKNNNSSNNNDETADKRFKTLPLSEALPRNETVGGYIFVCNNDTMQENLRRQLFGLPPRYRDSVRAITPGLPLFLYN